MPFKSVGKGFLMKSDKKSDKSPDYTGKIELSDGEEMQLSAWLEESKSGKKYLSLQLSVHEDEEPRSRGSRPSSRFVDDDDIPF